MKGRKVVFALIVLALVAVLLESATRVAFPGITAKAEFMQFTNPHRDQPDGFLRDPVLFWRPRPDNPTWQVNAAGYRGPLRRREKPTGTLRICCLGDSCTFGLGTPPLEYEQTYAAVLEKILREKLMQPVEVLNFGCPGYTSFQGRKLLETEVTSYHPDIVTAYFGINDGFPAIGFPDAEQKAFTAMPGLVGRLQGAMRHSAFYVLLTRGLTWTRTASGKEEILRVSLKEFSENAEAMRNLGRQDGFFMLFLPAYYINDEGGLSMESVSKEEPFVDLGEAFSASGQPADRLFFAPPDRVHPTALGHELIARKLAEEIEKRLKN